LKKKKNKNQVSTYVSLKEKLKPSYVDNFEPLPTILLKKYIGYAKKYIHPKLSIEAIKLLQKFYLSLRKSHISKDSTPITTRQLESLIRLSQARAKIELRNIVTEQDALDVIEIMKDSLNDVLTDENGLYNFKF
jgi:DNA helicase MCM8